MRDVLFVCTGNLCRSPLAAGLFCKAARELGAQIGVASAGIWASDGASPPWEIVQLAREEGLDISRHVARPISRDAFSQADLVIVMEPGHREALHALYGEEEGKIRLLSDFTGGSSRGGKIADPFEQSIAQYRASLDQIREAISGLLRHLGAPI